MCQCKSDIQTEICESQSDKKGTVTIIGFLGLDFMRDSNLVFYHLHSIIQHKPSSHPLKISLDQSPWPGLHHQLSTWPEKASIGGVQVLSLIHI